MSSEALRGAEQACNICGKAWPNHHPACAYVGNVRDLRAAEAAARAREQRLADALRGMIDRYVGLVASGDCGFWDAETEQEVIEARTALERE